jgi:hypothetical protein
MKSIDYQGIEIFYRIDQVQENDNCCIFRTSFYLPNKVYKYKKFFFFGKPVFQTVPKMIFYIDESIENPALSKEWWKATLKEKYNIIIRAKEIADGQTFK